MIGFLKGRVAGIYEEQIILDVGGIGFNIKMPASSIALISGLDDELKVYTYMAVREDSMLLYGFLTKDDLDLYKLLIQVNGIGPKGALAILSSLTADDLRFAILSGDVKTISKAPGIGSKSAQRLIIDLKDRLSLEDAFERKLEGDKALDTGSDDTPKAEAMEALTALGYSKTDAMRAVNGAKASGADDVESILKEALKIISSL